MTEIGERIRAQRLNLGLTQAELASRLGYRDKSTIAKIESGVNGISERRIAAFAGALGLTPAELLGLEPTREGNAILLPDRIRMIPLYEKVSAGFGALAADYIVDYLPLPMQSEEEAKRTLCIRVSGDSMYPKIENGDVIVVRRQDSVDSGSVAVLMIGGDEAVVKRVVYAPGEDWLELHSFNPEYKTRRFVGAEMERIKVLGLVKQVIKSL